MTRTARRRWSREFQGEIDGIGLLDTGPVLVHGYDPPAGGKWIDNVIPGKLAAFDRNEGDALWVSPCEVGYGRGFGIGRGEEDDIVVVGPSNSGYRVARMSIASGELIGAAEIRTFDQALVFGDMTICVTPDRICGIMTTPMIEVWSYSRENERYHIAGRSGDHVLVVFTEPEGKRQGVLRLDVESGDFVDTFIAADYACVHEMVTDRGIVILLTGDRAPSRRRQSSGVGNVQLEAFRSEGNEAHPLWRSPVTDDSPDDLPDVSIALDSDKLYLSNGVQLEVRDGLSGRELGQLTIAGLDERVAWEVSQGAGLLAEETRVSMFELPA